MIKLGHLLIWITFIRSGRHFGEPNQKDLIISLLILRFLFKMLLR